MYPCTNLAVYSKKISIVSLEMGRKNMGTQQLRALGLENGS